MKIAVIGSRTLMDDGFVTKVMDEVSNRATESFTILLGGANGVQDITKEWCSKTNTDYILFKPWHMVDSRIPFEPRLFFMRNKQIIDNSDMVVVIKNDKEEDSEVDRAVDYMDKRGKEALIFHYSSEDEDAA